MKTKRELLKAYNALQFSKASETQEGKMRLKELDILIEEARVRENAEHRESEREYYKNLIK